jgi:2-keto-4-pentenoate hydratase/2-oxohepta-3-ene-1,7-dioic acid hydratase in catechol pathway
MRLVRYLQHGQPHYGQVDGDRVHPISGDPFGRFEVGPESLALADLTLLAPVQPRQILAVGINYRSHVHDRPVPQKPELFLKPPSAVIGPGAAIVLPPDALDTHAEGELVIVIGQRARHVSPEEALSAVFGYTIGNDVSERTWQKEDRQWWRAKGCDTFAPLGPAIVKDVDWRTLSLTTTINGEVVQEGTTDDLIFDIPTIVSFASRYVTLAPGDVIFTGTPGHTRTLHAGDTVAITVPAMGTLHNLVWRDSAVI